MISRRSLLASGLALGLAGCARHPLAPVNAPSSSQASAVPPPVRARATPGLVDEPALIGLNAVIDLHHRNQVTSFEAARDDSGILAVLHKCSEGDWLDPLHDQRRAMAEAAGLLWGSYHFGTGQHPGATQARMFLAAARPGPTTRLALDLEPNERAPANSMGLSQAEDFVREILSATGRLPLLYIHPNWADGRPVRGRDLGGAILPGTLLSQCDLWLADYRAEPELPTAWSGKGWTLWQYVGDSPTGGGPFRDRARLVRGIDRCDRSVFAGDRAALMRQWGAPMA